ncbi:MAG: RecQ family ATP-dependent DNA helicase [Rhodocyclaceae bacterium]|nr:RecQ family ATP-dependent DNA helicase [Rhodocyclaceae bacterium]
MNSPQIEHPEMAERDFAPRCLSIDLEVGVKDGRIHEFAGVRGDGPEKVVFPSDGNLAQCLSKLDDLAEGAAFVLGHNLIRFDLPQLAAHKSDLKLLSLPAVDTLWLNPLAHPKNPYHHLVKHYQDGKLQAERVNDPELDARLALNVFREQQAALSDLNRDVPELLLAWHWLTTVNDDVSGTNRFFAYIRDKARPTETQAMAAIAAFLADKACVTAARVVLAEARQQPWPLAYALAWLSVAGGNSVMPPWVRHQFPEAGALVRRLRDQACLAPDCPWCRERHDAQKELKRWFGHPDFRPEPKGEDGRPLQQAIVEAAMAGEHALAILPTGTGKSLCYQIPALSRFEKTGALSVVISPLVALMEDQVAGLMGKGGAAAINGLLSMPERRDVLDKLRLGDVGILLIAPEQLRNPSVRKALEQREIGAWVLDEAHCLSKWGHDFRPDYRYVGRYIKEKAGNGPVPPVLCLTATAKPEVVAEILGYFRDRLGVELRLFDGGARRTNLEFTVSPTTPAEKFAHAHQYLEQYLPADTGGAIVYCASRRQTEEIAGFLREKGWRAEHFHAGLKGESKKDVQGRFIGGEIRVIAATNAFGMGIDKPDVRLVIHADIPGSLENYLQEAGRAGRDREPARCVLLYAAEDTERQFGLSARSRLSQKEIQAILKSLWNLDRRKRGGGRVVATTGEILREEEEGDFNRDTATDDTRVKTAVSWLEEAELISREENRVQVFPSSLRVKSVADAADTLARRGLASEQQGPLLAIVGALVNADPDEGISTDELMTLAGLSPEKLRKALYDLESLGIASNDTRLTAFVHVGVERSSQKRLEEAVALEKALIAHLREAAPELGAGEASVLHLRRACQRLKDGGRSALPEKLVLILKGLSEDGRSEDGGMGSLKLRRLDAESLSIKLQREWGRLEEGMMDRVSAAKLLLLRLLSSLPAGSKGVDLLAEVSLGDLKAVLDGDMVLIQGRREGDTSRLLDRTLLWLHEQDVIRLNKGLTVFRSAMTLRLSPEKRGFRKPDFEPLSQHYTGQVEQIHVMAEYAQRGLAAVADAIRLALDYFRLDHGAFMEKWLPGREKDMVRQTTSESWQRIVEDLRSRGQKDIVTDDRQKANVLVLAGPGSGKTRVLVHRIAYLVRVKRERPDSIVALTYNRHAAVEVRKRLFDLIGDDARGVTVLTCDALAMRLSGASFAEREKTPDFEAELKAIRRQAVALLNGEGLPPEEADEQRDRLLSGFDWILVDEYQDIGPEQYELIAALAGRSLRDDDSRLNLFAVGDDDQNIYAFNGASVEYIRRFESDYAAKPAYLTRNYRSTAHIIQVANAMIAPAARRMKAAHPIAIDRAREKMPAGGSWTKLDPVAQGRVQILPVGPTPLTQAQAVMTELGRLAGLAPDWDWSRCAVIARNWAELEPVRAWCELHGVPAQKADEQIPVWQLRETQALLAWLREARLVDGEMLRKWLAGQGAGPWWELLAEAVAEYTPETGGAELPAGHFIEWLAEWGREAKRRQRGLLLLSAHRAKGLEFDHVAVLDGGWEQSRGDEDPDAPRRLYYVAMTRARQTLSLARLDLAGRRHPLLDGLSASDALLRRSPCILPAPDSALERRYVLPNLGEVDLGFAGRQTSEVPLHGYIAALKPGDPLQLRPYYERWELADSAGHTVGRLSHEWKPPAGMECIEVRVWGIIRRTKEQTLEKYLPQVRAVTWEVVLPEMVFQPV